MMNSDQIDQIEENMLLHAIKQIRFEIEAEEKNTKKISINRHHDKGYL